MKLIITVILISLSLSAVGKALEIQMDWLNAPIHESTEISGEIRGEGSVEYFKVGDIVHQVEVVSTEEVVEIAKPKNYSKQELALSKAGNKMIPNPIFFLRGELVSMEESELRCLAFNIYLEGRNRSVKTRTGFAWASVSRIGKYGNKNICDVVSNSRRDSTGHIEDGKCHFSWYCDSNNIVWDEGEPFNIIKVAYNNLEDKAYRESVRIADSVLREYKKSGMKNSPIGNVTHYHRDDVFPAWRKNMVKLAKLDDHIFYHGH